MTGPGRASSDDFGGISRRSVILGLAGLATGTPLLRRTPLGPSMTEGSRIDLHHHYFPPVAKKRYGPFAPIQEYSPGRAIEEMDRAGIATAFLSLPTRLGDDPIAVAQEAVGFARAANEHASRLVSDHDGRFGFFAYLPLPNIDASLREIDYAFDTLGADGVGLLTSYGGRWLGDRTFQPVFEELDRRRAIVYSHPTDGPCCRGLLPNTIPQTVEWNTDTSRAIWSLINDGTDRPPVTTPTTSAATLHEKITFIWSHAGGTLLGLVGRFLNQPSRGTVDLSPTAARNSKLDHLRRFYYDTALSANPIQMQALRELVGASQIVLGSDYPFVPILDTVNGLRRCGFSPGELDGICRMNALRVLPHWRSRTHGSQPGRMG